MTNGDDESYEESDEDSDGAVEARGTRFGNQRSRVATLVAVGVHSSPSWPRSPSSSALSG